MRDFELDTKRLGRIERAYPIGGHRTFARTALPWQDRILTDEGDEVAFGQALSDGLLVLDTVDESA